MKKLKHEAELFKAGLLAGIQYAEKRKAVEDLRPQTRQAQGVVSVSACSFTTKLISPMPEDQVSEKTIRHRLGELVCASIARRASAAAVEACPRRRHSTTVQVELPLFTPRP